MAGLVKEQQLTRELDQMRGIVPEDILNALKKKKLGLPGVDVEVVNETRSQFQMGFFDVVNEIIEIYGEPARIAKCQVTCQANTLSLEWELSWQNFTLNSLFD